jgi:hypothetical protein
MAGHVQILLRISLLYLTLAVLLEPQICSSCNGMLNLKNKHRTSLFQSEFDWIYHIYDVQKQFNRIKAASNKNTLFEGFKIDYKTWLTYSTQLQKMTVCR